MKKRFRWDKRYLYWGITAFCVIAACIIVFQGLVHWRSIRAAAQMVLGILKPFIYGLVLAYLLHKPVRFAETKLFRGIKGKSSERAKRARRALSVLLVMLLVLVLIGGGLALLLPQLYTSLMSLANRLPDYFTDVMNWIGGFLEGNPRLESIVLGMIGNVEESLTGWMRTTLLAQVNTILTGLTTGVIEVVRSVINIAVGFVVAVYVLYHRERFNSQFKKVAYAILRPKHAESLFAGFGFLDRTCGSFITSKLIDSLIVGVVCWIAMSIANIPYALIVSIIVGVTNVIPFFGPFIGAIPSALLILMESPMKCLIFVIMILIIQQLDGNVLFPRLQGSALKLSGFWILFAILFFGGLFGFWGMLLGVPIFYSIYYGVSLLINRSLRSRGFPTDSNSFESTVSIPDPPPEEPASGGENE